MSGSQSAITVTVATMLAVSCAKLQDQTGAKSAYCAPQSLTSTSSFASDSSGTAGADTAVARVFKVDPVNSSGIPTLSPASLKLDDYRMDATLYRLSGRGVLDGNYVEVRNGLSCGEWFGAYETRGNFVYSHSDPRFQETMAYHMGDEYRALLDKLGYLRPIEPVRIVAHCMKDDNAFYMRQQDLSGQIIGKVCLGDSIATPGASYADDGVVTVHELQHATTIDLYTGGDAHQSLNQFWYDEAGGLNEAVSDFAALAYTVPSLSDALDPRVFSRWALDKFYPGSRGTRGTHRCAEYDGSFKSNCSGFPGFSSDNNQVSYVYPDGLGWPYANNYKGPDLVRSAFNTYRSKEEIHNVAILLEGALWDVFEAIKSNHNGDSLAAQALTLKATLEALRHLPRPTLKNLSPVTFRAFVNAWTTYAGLVGLNAADQEAARQAFTARGLLGGRTLESNWAAVGAGALATPGLKIEDNPNKLKSWLYSMQSDTSLVTQGIETGINNQLDPGEVVALWFDLKNVSDLTAGGVGLNITSKDPEVTFLDARTNIGAVSSSQAQIQYFKVNGTAIVEALSGPNYPIGTGNSYFLTHPFFALNWSTAVWAKVSPTAAHGKVVTFQVETTPSNGATSTVLFTAKIN